MEMHIGENQDWEAAIGGSRGGGGVGDLGASAKHETTGQSNKRTA